MADTKTEWRVRLLRARAAIDAGSRETAAAAIAARLVTRAEFGRAGAVLLYSAIGAEVDVEAVAREARRRGKSVYRPASAGTAPAWLVDDTMGVHPTPVAELAFPVLMIVPGVGFDRRGGRLGRGQAYFDRTIAVVRAAGDVAVVGVAYEAQIAETLPQDPWDERVDLVVTERRVLVPQPSRRDDSRTREEVRDDL